MRYLKTSNQLDSKREERFRTAQEITYQTIRKNIAFDDGSFRVIDETSEQSLWMTAFICENLHRVKEFINVDESFIKRGLDFVVKRQQKDGSYPDKIAKYWYFRNRSNYNIALNAFILIAIMESEYAVNYEESIQKSINYILNEKIDDKDNYAIAMIAYVMSLRNSTLAKVYQYRLMRNAIEHSSKYLYWYQDFQMESDISQSSYQLEIASYAMFSFIETKDYVTAYKIFNWIIQLSFDGHHYVHTLDTIVGVDAMRRFTSLIYATHETNVNLQFKRDDSVLVETNLNAKNSKIESRIIKLKNNNLKMISEGIRNVFIAIKTKFSVEQSDDEDQFKLSIDDNFKFCVSFIPSDMKKVAKNVKIQINYYGGFEGPVDRKKLFKIEGEHIYYESDQRMLMSYDKIDSTGKCMKIRLKQPQHHSTDLEYNKKFVKIFTYEYDHPEKFSVLKFSPWSS
jgi:hypothetical protein